MIVHHFKDIVQHNDYMSMQYTAIFTYYIKIYYDLYTLNVTMSGRNCNTIFDVLTSKMPNADRSKHTFVCGGDFVLIKSEHQNEYDRENNYLWHVIP